MNENVQVKVFIGVILLTFVGALYYKENFSLKAKDVKYQNAIDEAKEYCSKEISPGYKFYSDTFEERICLRDYLVDFKGISMKELNKFRIRQDLKNK